MGLKITNKRNLIKRSTVSGVVPTIPSSAVTNIYDHTAGGWLSTDIYVGELFINTADDKIWFRSDNGINLLGYSGTTTDFVDLNDTPSTYTPNAYLQVNSSGTAIEWTTLNIISDFINLNDSPGSYSGMSGKTLKVNSGETGLEFGDAEYYFTNLLDTPNTYTNYNNLLRVNSSITGLEFFDGSDIFIDKDSIQTINSAKTFLEKTTHNDILIKNDLYYSGLTFDSFINDIITNSGLTGYNDNTLVTSKAIKEYIDGIQFGTGSTSNFVTLNTIQSITAEKTFTSNINFNADINSTNIYNSNDIFISGNTFNKLSSYVYYGDATTDGSYRTFINVNGYLETQKRISGVWTFIQQI